MAHQYEHLATITNNSNYYRAAPSHPAHYDALLEVLGGPGTSNQRRGGTGAAATMTTSPSLSLSLPPLWEGASLPAFMTCLDVLVLLTAGAGSGPTVTNTNNKNNEEEDLGRAADIRSFGARRLPSLPPPPPPPPHKPRSLSGQTGTPWQIELVENDYLGEIVGKTAAIDGRKTRLSIPIEGFSTNSNSSSSTNCDLLNPMLLRLHFLHEEVPFLWERAWRLLWQWRGGRGRTTSTAAAANDLTTTSNPDADATSSRPVVSVLDFCKWLGIALSSPNEQTPQNYLAQIRSDPTNASLSSEALLEKGLRLVTTVEAFLAEELTSAERLNRQVDYLCSLSLADFRLYRAARQGRDQSLIGLVTGGGLGFWNGQASRNYWLQRLKLTQPVWEYAALSLRVNINLNNAC